jgi:hypothetical protein
VPTFFRLTDASDRSPRLVNIDLVTEVRPLYDTHFPATRLYLNAFSSKDEQHYIDVLETLDEVQDLIESYEVIGAVEDAAEHQEG